MYPSFVRKKEGEMLAIWPRLKSIVFTNTYKRCEGNNDFFSRDIIYTRHKLLIKLYKKHLQKQKTQHSLKTNAYNEWWTKH